MTGGDGTGQDQAPSSGRRAAEEAVRLLQTLSEVTGSHNAPECRICPICQLLAALRQVRPEAVDHLIDAAAGLAAALRDLAVPAAAEAAEAPVQEAPDGPPASPPAATASSGPSPGHDPPRIQRIEVTD